MEWIPYSTSRFVQTRYFSSTFDLLDLLAAHIPQYLRLLHDLIYRKVLDTYRMLHAIYEMASYDRVFLRPGRDMNLYRRMGTGEQWKTMKDELTKSGQFGQLLGQLC